MAATQRNIKVVKNEDTYRTAPVTRAENRLQAALKNPKVKWAKNTIVGTTKGVLIATAVQIAAQSVDQGARKALRHN